MMRSETATVGHIESTYELLEVDFVEKEEGSLVYSNQLEVGDNKHTLTYTYDVYLVSYASIDSQPLSVSTNNTNVSIVSYTSIMVNQTPQAVDVQIGLNNDQEYTEGEELNFQLVFNLSGNAIPEDYTPIEESPEEIVYDMNYTLGDNKTFDDGLLEFYDVDVNDGFITLDDRHSYSAIETVLNAGTISISWYGHLIVTVNSVEVFKDNESNLTTTNIEILEDNSNVIIQTTETFNKGYIEQIVYSPD